MPHIHKVVKPFRHFIHSQGRDGKGSVFVFSSGNGGQFDDDCSHNGFCTNINTIAIGSASVGGGQAFYDEKCSCKMAVNFVSGTSSLSVVSLIWCLLIDKNEQWNYIYIIKISTFEHTLCWFCGIM